MKLSASKFESTSFSKNAEDKRGIQVLKHGRPLWYVPVLVRFSPKGGHPKPVHGRYVMPGGWITTKLIVLERLRMIKCEGIEI